MFMLIATIILKYRSLLPIGFHIFIPITALV
jgi:hypothetical protein